MDNAPANPVRTSTSRSSAGPRPSTFECDRLGVAGTTGADQRLDQVDVQHVAGSSRNGDLAPSSSRTAVAGVRAPPSVRRSSHVTASARHRAAEGDDSPRAPAARLLAVELDARFTMPSHAHGQRHVVVERATHEDVPKARRSPDSIRSPASRAAVREGTSSATVRPLISASSAENVEPRIDAARKTSSVLRSWLRRRRRAPGTKRGRQGAARRDSVRPLDLEGTILAQGAHELDDEERVLRPYRPVRGAGDRPGGRPPRRPAQPLAGEGERARRGRRHATTRRSPLVDRVDAVPASWCTAAPA